MGLAFGVIMCIGVLVFHRTHTSFQIFKALSLDRATIPWSQRDLFDLTPEEQSQFFRDKELEYAKTRERIWSLCKNSTSAKSFFFNRRISGETFNDRMVHNSRHKVSYCITPKVASSTWSMHFIKLADVSQNTIDLWSEALQTLVVKLWPFPLNKNPLKVMEGQTSIVISRHPMERIASVYSQKLVNLGQTSWREFSTWIIRRYRTSGAKNLTNYVLADRPNKDQFVSPQEFVTFLIENLRDGVLEADVHWLPQGTLCPFCAFNFTVYAKMENLWEDTAYFMLKAGLTHLMDPGLKKNPTRKNDHLEYQRLFWSSVHPQSIDILFQIYEMDFQMFDYSMDRSFFAPIKPS